MRGRKYKRGKRIRSIDELAKQERIWDARTNKVYHHGWFQSWQFRYIRIGVNNGWFYTAEPIREER